jgi:hypothetical protein
VTAFTNPALRAFLAQLGQELLFAQVVIGRTRRGYELRHETDRHSARQLLRLTPVAALRELAQRTAAGAFRPLKSAPNLVSGWRAVAANDDELETALQALYPGAVADWFAARTQPPPVTHYREFTERQTGMYRVTTLLTDEQAAQVTRACCHRRFCLKRRLWTTGGLEPDAAEEKSLIPCLEPCALLLEFARKALRLEQENEGAAVTFPGELPSLEAALKNVLDSPTPGKCEADFNSPTNPRRLQLAIEKLKPPSRKSG